MKILRQSTAGQHIAFGPAVANTDGVTLVTNLVGTSANQLESTSTGIQLSKNGAAMAARHATAGTSTYRAYGFYDVILDATDSNTLGELLVAFSSPTTNMPIWEKFKVVPASVFDALATNDAGSSGGLFIAGSNAATTVASLTVSGDTILTGNFTVGGTTTYTVFNVSTTTNFAGAVTMPKGLSITQSTTNSSGLVITGNGTAAGIQCTGGTSGHGASFVGGATAGDGIVASATSSGHGINASAAGTSKHGIIATGSSGGTGDGIKGVAGTSGVGMRLDSFTVTANMVVTGNITENGVALPTTSDLPTINVSGGVIEANVKQINGQTATAAAGVTFPSSIASPTNITAGTITTVTNLTNAPTAGDLTATMKTSVQTAADSAVTANTYIATMKKYLEADQYTVTTTTPWSLVYIQAGTGAPGTGTTLMTKRLFDVSAHNITKTSQTVGRAIQ